MNPLNGDYSIMIVPNEYIDEPIGFRQARTHRKKRINKKWKKRYGDIPIYDDTVIVTEYSVFMGGHTYEKLKRKINERSN